VNIGWTHVAAALAALGFAASTANAQLYIYPPDFSGSPVTGTEPGITLPLPGANSDELRSSLVWNLRAGLNVAALQCQFSPMLATVRNYNQLLRHQATELEQARKSLEGYFKRTNGKTGLRAFDQYTTRTYNGFSTLHAQLGFCNTAALIGRAALGTPKGELYQLAVMRLREFRNSLIPVGDRILAIRYNQLSVPRLIDPCLDKRGQRKRRC
jgi:hypothetical protein